MDEYKEGYVIIMENIKYFHRSLVSLLSGPATDKSSKLRSDACDIRLLFHLYEKMILSNEELEWIIKKSEALKEINDIKFYVDLSGTIEQLKQRLVTNASEK